MHGAYAVPAERPSRLAIDLALTRVGLAALKVQAHIGLNDEEINSARLLKDTLARDLTSHNGLEAIPASLVPQDTMRIGLEETLRTLTPASYGPIFFDRPIVGQLVALLERLTSHSGFSADDAEQLLTVLNELRIRSRNPEDLFALSGTTGA